MALSYLFAFVVMLSVLIFVHEAGHFIVAKLCGVRVLKFSLGFGPAIGFGRHRLSWTRGDTEYVLAWIPLGGFVKMLGENPDEAGDPEVRAHASESLPGKPLWQKLAIVFAGPVMNLVFPVVVFMATLAVGIDRRDAVIGTVEAGSPAMTAGLEPGDRIVSVAGEPIHWWDELDEAVTPRPGEALALVAERDGSRREVSLTIAARSGLDEFGQVREVGWLGLGQRRLRAMVGIPDGGSLAAAAGLESGDVVTHVAGASVEDWHGFVGAYAAAAKGGSVAVDVERRAEEEAEPLRISVPALGDVAALGVVPTSVLISGVSPGSPAARGGLATGDLVLSVDDEAVGSFASFAETVRTSRGRTLRLAFARDGRLHEVAIAPELVSADVGLGMEDQRYMVGITAEAASLPGAVALDRERNPFRAFSRSVGMTVDVTRSFLRGLGKLVTGEVSSKQLAGPIGIAEIAGEAFKRGWETYLAVMVLISINLGILNLLPIPILDGGQALLYLVEGVKRSPLSLRTRELVQQVGLTVLVLLMGLAFWNDISRNWSRVMDWLRTGSGL
jgi:regulator of sigma E protease